nr:MAG TPA: hypothetical protein [Caudoviricetes sp.]
MRGATWTYSSVDRPHRFQSTCPVRGATLSRSTRAARH